jgi:hypothetical protein
MALSCLHPHIDQSGCWRKNLQKFLENSEFVWHGCCQGGVGGVFYNSTNQELSKSSCAKPRYPVIHQYGLQMAEGMVTFFESYERKLEKYWTKPLLFQLS